MNATYVFLPKEKPKPKTIQDLIGPMNDEKRPKLWKEQDEENFRLKAMGSPVVDETTGGIASTQPGPNRKEAKKSHAELLENMRLAGLKHGKFLRKNLNVGHGKILLFNGKGPISRLIKWQTGVRGNNGYSHAAVLTPDHTIIESWQGKGVRERDLLDDWDGVDAFDVDLTRLVLEEFDGESTKRFWNKVISEMKTQDGKKYDYKAIARFITRRKLEVDDRWFCSELVYWACQRAGVNLLADTVEASTVSPQWLRRSPLLVPVPLFMEVEG